MPTSISSLLSRMTDLDHQDVERTLALLLYGPPGGGKTVLGMGIAQGLLSDTGRILYIDSAAGWVSLDSFPSFKASTTHIKYEKSSDLFALAEAVRRKTKGFEDFEVVMIDELSSIADDILDDVVRAKHSTPPGEPTPEVEGQDYRPMGQTVHQAVVAFQKAGLHVIIVAHDSNWTDKQKNVNYNPSLSPKLRAKLQGLMHVTGRVTAEIGGTVAKPVYTRTVQAAPSARVEAKTRIGALRESTKISFKDFTEVVVDWVWGEEMGEDIANEENHELVPDRLPEDVIEESVPATDSDDDDEPAFVGSDDE